MSLSDLLDQNQQKIMINHNYKYNYNQTDNQMGEKRNKNHDLPKKISAESTSKKKNRLPMGENGEKKSYQY